MSNQSTIRLIPTDDRKLGQCDNCHDVEFLKYTDNERSYCITCGLIFANSDFLINQAIQAMENHEPVNLS